jgi:hypothetical protein
MAELTRLLEVTERVVPPAFDDLVALRRRRTRRGRAAMVCGLAAGVAVAVGALTLTGATNKSDAPPTTPSPSPTPSATFSIPSGQTTIPVDVRPGDIQEWDYLATLTNSQPEHRGATELSATATVHSDGASGENDVVGYCRASDIHTWTVTHIVTNGEEGDGFGECNPDDPLSLEPRLDIPQWTSHHFAEPVSVRMYVTRLSSEMEACLRKGVEDCEALYGVPQPLETTDAEFGFRIYEHRATRTVLTLWDQYAFEALSTIDHKPWIIDHAVVAAPGASHLAFALPKSDRRRLVGVYSAHSRHWDRCIAQHRRELPDVEPYTTYQKAADRVCGGFEFRLLVDGEYVEPPKLHITDSDGPIGFGDPVMYVAPGAHRVTVDVTGTDPRNVRYAVVIRKEQVQ